MMILVQIEMSSSN